jgi:hypothetical protein
MGSDFGCSDQVRCSLESLKHSESLKRLLTLIAAKGRALGGKLFDDAERFPPRRSGLRHCFIRI